MLKKVLLVVAVLLVGAVALVASRPSAFRFERAVTVTAPADVVFAAINDFKRWQQWSPWEKRDPAMTRSHEGNPTGVGAAYSWSGNDQVGSGRMTIVESQPPERVAIKLEFLKPMPATNQVEFILRPGSDGVMVTWAMSGQHNFMGKAFSLVADMDKMIGRDFEAGLASLKAVAEADAKAKAAATQADAAAAAPAPAGDAATPAPAPKPAQ